MITKQELIEYLKKQANRYHVDASLPQDDLMYDCSEDLGIPVKGLILVMFNKDKLIMHIVYWTQEIQELNQVEDIVNASWDRLSEILECFNNKYYKIRWEAGYNTFGMEPVITNKDHNCCDIYLQITGESCRHDSKFGYHAYLPESVKLISKIEDDIWRLGELLIKKYKYYKDSPIKYIRRIGNKIYLRKKWEDSAKFDTLGQMLFSNGFAYIIRDEDFDSFVMTLEIIGE